MMLKTTEDWIKIELAAVQNAVRHESSLMAVHTFAADALFSFCLYSAFKDMSNGEYRIALPNLIGRIFEAGGGDTMTALYVMAAICQRKADALFVWAHNTKAFKYMLSHELLNLWRKFD